MKKVSAGARASEVPVIFPPFWSNVDNEWRHPVFRCGLTESWHVAKRAGTVQSACNSCFSCCFLRKRRNPKKFREEVTVNVGIFVVFSGSRSSIIFFDGAREEMVTCVAFNNRVLFRRYRSDHCRHVASCLLPENRNNGQENCEKRRVLSSALPSNNVPALGKPFLSYDFPNVRPDV